MGKHIGWNFPSNNDGQEDGLNDAGIETFKTNPLDSLSREICQNSCDAVLDGANKPVEVHFTLLNLPIGDFPDLNHFKEILTWCSSYWSDNPKTRKFFDKAQKTMKGPNIPVLKVSDYNTTGLLGATDGGHSTDWYRLTKAVGASDKNSKAGGSFGIGKHAPYACSDIRTVFYLTLDSEEVYACQGVSKLVTHRTPTDETTQGTGYYGNKQKNKPILDPEKVPRQFYRDRVGTDIYIIGFNGGQKWNEQIIKSVLDNFFVAIRDNRLIVKVEDALINSSTLAPLIEQYCESDTNYLCGKYYQAMVAPDRFHRFIDDFEGLGKVEFFGLPHKDYPKRVAMVRATGMKIFDKKNFRTPLRFAGVMLASGERLNDLLRSIEPPLHNDWFPERHPDDSSYAKRILSKLNEWIRDCVKDMQPLEEAEEIDFDGLSQYLPDDMDELPPSIPESVTEGERNIPQKVEIEYIVKKSEPNNTSAGTLADDEDNDTDGATIEPGEIHNDSNDGSPTTLDNPGGKNDPSGKSNTTPGTNNKLPSKKTNQVNFKHKRAFCNDPDNGKYIIIFETDQDGSGYLNVSIVGEVGEDAASITAALDLKKATQLGIHNGNRIGPVQFEANQREQFEITLQESSRYALEVSIYGD